MINTTLIKQRQPDGSSRYFIHAIVTFSHTGYVQDGFEMPSGPSADPYLIRLRVRPTPSGVPWYIAYTPMVFAVPLPQDWPTTDLSQNKLVMRLVNADTGNPLAETGVNIGTSTSQDHPTEDLRPWP